MKETNERRISNIQLAKGAQALFCGRSNKGSLSILIAAAPLKKAGCNHKHKPLPHAPVVATRRLINFLSGHPAAPQASAAAYI